jgi:serine phosphatase RsbU (regulator of sigma subunit)
MCLGNFFGAASVFVYLAFIQVAAMDIGSAESGIWHFLGYMLVSLVAANLFSVWWDRPVLRPLYRLKAGLPPGDIPSAARQRALQLPLTSALVSAVIWFLAGIFFAIEGRPDNTTWQFTFWHIFLPITVGAGVPAVTFVYLLVDLVWREAMPLFFPHGDAARYSVARLSIRKRLFLLLPIITYFPMGFIILIAYNRAYLLAQSGDMFYLNNMLFSFVYVGVLAVVIIELGVTTLWHSIVQPVQDLQQAFEQVGQQKDLSTRLPVISNDEFGMLAADFNSMVAELEKGRAAEEERARIAHELELALLTQLSLLPRDNPRFPHLDVAASSQPAMQVGGDLYGYHHLADNHLAVTVGDVSGKGMTAALMMAATTGLIGANAGLMNHPSQLLGHLNMEMAFHTRQNGLNTALCITCFTLNGAGLRVEVANAGGVWPLLRRHSGHTEWLEVGGPPLGIGSADYAYPSLCRALAPNDVLVLSSDGVIEAKNKDDQLFGLDRLEMAVSRLNVTQPAAALQQQLLQAVYAFTLGHELHDDLTLLVLKVMA